MTRHHPRWKEGTLLAASLFSVGLAACGPVEGVQVQELPPAERPTLEARAGLLEIEGAWNHAGWVVASPDIDPLLPAQTPAALSVQAQRLDSLSGYVAGADASRRFVGELRRDGIVSLLVQSAEAPGAVLAGVVERDTLWLELSTVPGLEIPVGARAAFVRAPVGQAWVRLPTGVQLRDTVVTPVIPPATAAPAATPPRETAPPTTRETAPPAPVDTTPQSPRESPQRAPQDATPQSPRDTLRVDQPQPEVPVPSTPPVRDLEPEAADRQPRTL